MPTENQEIALIFFVAVIVFIGVGKFVGWANTLELMAILRRVRNVLLLALTVAAMAFIIWKIHDILNTNP